MSLATTVTERASTFLDRRTSRRGFVARTALVGSALTTAGSNFVLRPGSAYAAVCNCLGRSCDCSSLCCDGYTEFCCHIYGENSCPPNTLIAGWWKVDNSGFCDGAARYYMDCNKRSPNCSCGSSGVCRGNDTICRCRACSNRKDGCTAFRYGNCNNQVACVGPIMCRVVTCTKPWELEPTCSTAARTDNNTRSHHRACLDPPPRDPTDEELAWVHALYVDYLGRDGTRSEHEFWGRELVGGRSKRSIARTFSLTNEYIDRFIHQLYQLAFGRDADSAGLKFWRDKVKDGKTVTWVAERIYSSDEFYSRSGGTTGGFVDAVYEKILGRPADDAGRAHWIERIDSGTPRSSVVRGFYASTESRHQRVHRLYRHFLNRKADAAGLDLWTRKLSNGDDIALTTFLVASAEYQRKAEDRFLGNGSNGG